MADGVDAKGIGVGAKDVVMGILGAVAGGFGGAAGASAVDKADKGINKLVGAAGGGDLEQPTTSRADRMDQADKPPGRKNAGPPPASEREVASSKAAATGPPPASEREVASSRAAPAGPPAASPSEVASSQGKPNEVDWPPAGDARVTADFLSKQGYSREKIRTILSGAQGSTVAEVTQDGSARSVEGTRIAQSEGRPARLAQASNVPIRAAEPVASVAAMRVADSERVPSVAGSAVPIVSGRRIDNKGGPQTA